MWDADETDAEWWCVGGAVEADGVGLDSELEYLGWDGYCGCDPIDGTPDDRPTAG